MPNQCLTCGLKTQAKKHCGYCKSDPNIMGPLATYIQSFSPTTRRQILKYNKAEEIIHYMLTGASIVDQTKVRSIAHSQPLDLSTSSGSEDSPSTPNIAESTIDGNGQTERFKAKSGPHGFEANAIAPQWSNNDGESRTTESFVGIDEMGDLVDTRQWISYPIEMTANHLRFGTFITSGHTLQLNEDGLTLTQVMTNSLTNPMKLNVLIRFRDITGIKYCSNGSLNISMILVKTTQTLNKWIQMVLNVGPNSLNGLLFDVDSDGIFTTLSIIFFYLDLFQTLNNVMLWSFLDKWSTK